MVRSRGAGGRAFGRLCCQSVDDEAKLRSLGEKAMGRKWMVVGGRSSFFQRGPGTGPGGGIERWVPGPSLPPLLIGWWEALANQSSVGRDNDVGVS